MSLNKVINLSNEDKRKFISFRNEINIPSTTYATFGLYRYPAKFIPHVIAYILENYASLGMKIFDPFAGYGTVGVLSKIYGYDYELWDLNPMLEILHSVSIMNPISINIEEIISKISKSNELFIPKWSRLAYWYPKEFLPFIYKIWGYYHNLPETNLKLALTIPLLKVTRYFSYDDQQRQKLSKSDKSRKRIKSILSTNWKLYFFTLLQKEIDKLLIGIRQYNELSPKKTKSIIKSGIDTLNERLSENKDLLITSPPYLQSQEYIRQAKLDLFWLGYSEEYIKTLNKLEIPYRDIEKINIYSKTYNEYRNKLSEIHIKKVYDRYFWGVLGALSRLQKNISNYLCLFVGHTSARGNAIPIDKIFIEHLSEFGWDHVETLVDTIISRRLFSYSTNPATGIKDKRTSIENLVILKKIY